MQRSQDKLDSSSVDTVVKMNVKEWISSNYLITSNEVQNILVCFIPE